MQLILASASPYRRMLLERLGLPFSVYAADINEDAQPNETPAALAQRLAFEKAEHVAKKHPNAIVIGSDQVAALGEQRLGKPGTHQAASAQLRLMSGQTVHFYTAISVCHQGQSKNKMNLTTCKFRTLTEDEIQYYLQQEQPYDTAGSAKAEGLGIALMHSIQADDPTAIIGLPLIGLCALLRQFGLDPLSPRP